MTTPAGDRATRPETAIRLPENLDAMAARSTLEELNRAIAAGARTIVCDFSRTDYISSIGIGVILSAYKRLTKTGGEIALAGMNPKVRSIFETANLLPLFTVRP